MATDEVTGKPPRARLEVPVDERWPDGHWIPLGRLVVNTGLRPGTPPAVRAEDVKRLRYSLMLAWSPIFVIPHGRDFVILDGIRRAKEAKRRGATHIYAYIGGTDKPVLEQLRAFGLPTTVRTVMTWAIGVAEAVVKAVRRER